MIAKLLIVGVIGLGVAGGPAASQAAPVIADGPFDGVTCTCQPAPPAPGQTSEDRMNQGMHDAFTR